ncbi:MAG: hypothetical protein JNK26_01625, partial [Candidatus Doudnabacteria bacterium]|nr:hypothetical protein [Candidatus Doudnabacteria bacterium]
MSRKYLPNNYSSVDLDRISYFDPYFLDRYRIVNVPSEGLDGSAIARDKVERMLFLQMAESISIGSASNIFLNYLPLPEAEQQYRDQLFANRPQWVSMTSPERYKSIPEGEQVTPLDKAVAGSESTLTLLQELLSKQSPTDKQRILFGYHQTEYMRSIAQTLGISYLNNLNFARWAGSKLGLQEFLDKHNLPAIHALTIYSKDDIFSAIGYLKGLNYKKAVFKVKYSTGGEGHRIIDLSEAAAMPKNGLDQLLPKEYKIGDGLILQGWLEEEDIDGMSSLDLIIDENNKCNFIFIKSKFSPTGRPLEPACYLPIDRSQFEQFENIRDHIAHAYTQENAYGPHSINLIHPSAIACKKYGFSNDIPLIHDENPRIGVSKIAHHWISRIKRGEAGTGWVYSKIYTNTALTFAE